MTERKLMMVVNSAPIFNFRQNVRSQSDIMKTEH